MNFNSINDYKLQNKTEMYILFQNIVNFSKYGINLELISMLYVYVW
jgi:hypothetical protein